MAFFLMVTSIMLGLIKQIINNLLHYDEDEEVPSMTSLEGNEKVEGKGIETTTPNKLLRRL